MLAIAYDNVHYSNQPETWNMRQILGISSILGIFGVLSSFRFILPGFKHPAFEQGCCDDPDVFKVFCCGSLDCLRRPHKRAFLVRKAGQDTLARCRRHTSISHFHRGLWSADDPIRLGTCRPCLGYSLVMFLIQDRVKLLAYKIFPMSKTTPPAAPVVLTKNVPISPKHRRHRKKYRAS